MSRRQGLPWAATSVPEIRRQWCNALDHTAERFTSEGLSPPEPGTPGSRRLERMQSKLAAEMEIMKAETRAIGDAEMFWVARDMVDTALDAAATLPEWTPTLACPTPNGLLCWAKPAGTVPFGPRLTATTAVPWDAVWWWMRPDGMLHMSPSSRFTKHPDLIAPFQVNTPLWSAHTIVIDPTQPRTEEANGTEAAHPFVSVVGAAWLLMGQPAVTETRAIADTTAAPRSNVGTPEIAPPPPVTLIDMRRPQRAPHDPSEATGERQYNRRWWVGGHWRQQACGPNRSQRKPIYVAPYIKGPEDKPLSGDRVNVWRR